MSRGLLIAVIAAAVLTGCSGSKELNCEPAERYGSAGSVGPVRVPDDLNLPDESNSLRLPPAPVGSSRTADGCLESPPGFFDESRLRGAERSPADGPSSAEPEPAADPDRQISN